MTEKNLKTLLLPRKIYRQPKKLVIQKDKKEIGVNKEKESPDVIESEKVKGTKEERKEVTKIVEETKKDLAQGAMIVKIKIENLRRMNETIRKIKATEKDPEVGPDPTSTIADHAFNLFLRAIDHGDNMS